MNLYDIISEISQKQCDKLYETKLSVGQLNLEARQFFINNLKIDFEDLTLSDTVCQKLMLETSFNALCIQTQNSIFIIDKLGEI